MTDIKKKHFVLLGLIFSIILGILVFSDNANAATKSFSGSIRTNPNFGDKLSEEIKNFSITTPGYLYLDLEVTSIDDYYDYKFYENDKLKIHIKGFDDNGKVIYSVNNLLRIKEDRKFSSAWFHFGGGDYKIPAAYYKVWLTYGSEMNCYKIDYTLQYYKKTIKKIKLPKKIKMRVGQARYYKIKNKIDKNTFACVGLCKQSNNKVIADGDPQKMALFIYAKKPGKCKLTVQTTYGIKTKVTVIIKKKRR